MSIAIVTDSTCDLPTALIETYSIHVVPNLVIIGGESYEDGVGITREAFYNQLPGMSHPPTTATSSAGVYQKLYEDLLSRGAQSIISIHAASQLSGIFNAAMVGAQPFEPLINVLDSGQLSLGLGFQVLAAAQVVKNGATLDTVLEKIKEVSRKVYVMAMLDTLEYIRRSGRVSWARARLGNLLQVKPFLSIQDGKVFSLGEVRTRSKGINQIKEMILNLGPLHRLAILHTNAEEEANQILAGVQAPSDGQPLVVHVTTVIGAHVGPRGLGFAAIVE